MACSELQTKHYFSDVLKWSTTASNIFTSFFKKKKKKSLGKICPNGRENKGRGQNWAVISSLCFKCGWWTQLLQNTWGDVSLAGLKTHHLGVQGKQYFPRDSLSAPACDHCQTLAISLVPQYFAFCSTLPPASPFFPWLLFFSPFLIPHCPQWNPCHPLCFGA